MNEFTKTIINGLKTYIQKSRGNWNQNDETAVDYIKNRTHWSEVGLVEILPEITIYIEDHDKISNDITLELGKTYNVTFNGKEYNCTAWSNDEAILIGNGSIYGGEDVASGNIGGNNEPFSCDNEDGTLYLNVSESGTHTVRISYQGEVIHKIDKKYLPEISSIKNVLDGSAEGSVRTIGTNTEIGEYAFAEGSNTTASGDYGSHAEGHNTTASGASSHAEGSYTTASGASSHAEGEGTIASGDYSHAEGQNTKASGLLSHAEGRSTTASGYSSHAEGDHTTASGKYSHAEGQNTKASGVNSHAEGSGSSGDTSFKFNMIANAKTYTLTNWNFRLKVGKYLTYKDVTAKITAIDENTKTVTVDKTLSSTDQSNVYVYLTSGIASGKSSHAEGEYTTASGDYSHAEGIRTVASGKASHAEGQNTGANGDYSHAEGSNTTASGDYSHAEGGDTTASGDYSHAEGSNTTASGDYGSHAEGHNTTASGQSSHAEGAWTTASGQSSHAEGQNTKASGVNSHAEGAWTTALSNFQHVQGKYNIEDANNKYAHIVGNGKYSNDGSLNSNAHTLDWKGNAWFQGDVYIGGTSQDNGEKLITESEISKPKPYFTLIDSVSGYKYIIEMRNGNLVSRCGVSSIEVTTMPDEIEYYAGEYFDPTGMVVTATREDGSVIEITNYTCSDNQFVIGANTVTISYNEAGNTYTTTIIVNAIEFDVATILIDFEYTDNGDGTYTITGWKGTKNGVASTEMVVPDSSKIIL